MMDPTKEKKKFSLQEAIPKAEKYCVYQERCHKEVRDKLFGFGLSEDDVLQAMNSLVKRGFLNEERFAIAFAGGKFRQKNWGKTKITLELKKRGISEFCIRKALENIGDEDYLNKGKALAEKYIRLHPKDKGLILKTKTFKHLISKGYEYDQCHEIINGIDW